MPEKLQHFEVVVNEYEGSHQLEPTCKYARPRNHRDYLRLMADVCNSHQGVVMEVTRSTVHLVTNEQHRQRIVAHYEQRDTKTILEELLKNMAHDYQRAGKHAEAGKIAFALQLLRKVLAQVVRVNDPGVPA